MSINGIQPSTWESSCRSVLALLHDRTHFDMWMMTETVDDDWTVLYTKNRSYAVEEGAVLRWSDSFCSRMVDGQGPRVVPTVEAVDCYVNAPIRQQVPIGAYMGVPLNYSDGRLFGTLCAIDPQPKPASIYDELSLVELCGDLLGNMLTTEQRSLELEALLKRCREEAHTDWLTGVFNRSGWEASVTIEERQAIRYGTPISVMVIDLDDLKCINDNEGHRVGDALLKTTGQLLHESLRESDIVARLGGDEFAVLLLNCDGSGVGHVVQKVEQALVTHGINASIGYATRGAASSLEVTLDQADRAMYHAKSLRKSH